MNQDRSFHGRLRLWKEGWWKQWTPQIVLGVNDPGSHSDHGGGNITFDDMFMSGDALSICQAVKANRGKVIVQVNHAPVISTEGYQGDQVHLL